MTDLVTLSDVKLELGIPDASTSQDALLTIDIAAATEVIERIKGPILPRTLTAEQHDGRGFYVSLDYRPVISVTSVTEYVGTTAFPLTVVSNPAGAGAFSCQLDTEAGTLTRLTTGGAQIGFANGEGNIQVTYVAGRASVPPSVRLAAMRLIQWWHQSAKQGARPQFQGGQAGAPPAKHGATMPSYAVPNFVYHLLEAGDGVRIPGMA